MESLNKIVKYLDTYLTIDSISDISWNGLQYEGNTKVNKIILAVDAGIETFNQVVKEKAEMVIVHHGLFWKYTNPSIEGFNKKRIEILFRHNISLYACHLPLDKHGISGNNAQLLKIIGADMEGDFSCHNGAYISYFGTFKRAVSLTHITDQLNQTLSTKCQALPFGKKKIKSVGVVSGSGGYADIEEAIKQNLDLIITGDTLEVYHLAKDAGLNVIFAGHHASEILGMRALGEVISKEMAVKIKFIDIPTGL